MYEIKLYETNLGNRPVEKYIAKLVKNNKDVEVLAIKAYFDCLKEFGFEINKKFKSML